MSCQSNWQEDLLIPTWTTCNSNNATSLYLQLYNSHVNTHIPNGLSDLKNKKVTSLLEALIFASTNPQSDIRLFITSSIHENSKLKPGENMLCTEIVPDIQNNFCTQHFLPMFCKKKSFWQRFTCTKEYLYLLSFSIPSTSISLFSVAIFSSEQLNDN